MHDCTQTSSLSAQLPKQLTRVRQPEFWQSDISLLQLAWAQDESVQPLSCRHWLKFTYKNRLTQPSSLSQDEISLAQLSAKHVSPPPCSRQVFWVQVKPVEQLPQLPQPLTVPHSAPAFAQQVATLQSFEQLCAVSPLSHWPLPQTAPALPQSDGHELLVSPDSQVPLPQTGPAVPQSAGQVPFVSPDSQVPLPQTGPPPQSAGQLSCSAAEQNPSPQVPPVVSFTTLTSSTLLSAPPVASLPPVVVSLPATMATHWVTRLPVVGADGSGLSRQ